jgi:CDP-diacylglycerol--serine O-phosphatidyltransferase
VVTILALSAGMTALKFALAERWELAAFSILLAGIFDGIDGSIARLLKSVSRFGAELDSLSDVISFGVAPAVIMYLWALRELGGLGWVIALAYAICMALRLARFNSKLDTEDEPRKKAGFLTGIPAPMAAALVLMPIILGIQTESDFFRSPALVGITTALVSLGMVSRMATFSFKQMIIPRDQMVPLLLLVGLFAAAVTVYQWAVVVTLGVVYVSSFPLSMQKYSRIAKADGEAPEAKEGEGTEPEVEPEDGQEDARD